MTSRTCSFALIGLCLWACGEPTTGLSSPAEGDSTPTTSETQQTSNTSTNVETDGLNRAVGLVLGAPLPNGLELLHRDEVVARYVTEIAFDLLTEFYERELDGYAIEQSEDIVKCESDDEDTPVIFIVRGEQGLNRVVYFGADADAEMSVDVSTIFDDDTTETTPRFRFPQGPVAVDPAWIASEIYVPPRTVDSDLYDVQYEERDGQTVEVLVLRPADEETVIQLPDIDESAPGAYRSRNLGSYVRGDDRSLRSIQDVDDSGQPLPFVGTTSYELPEGFEN